MAASLSTPTRLALCLLGLLLVYGAVTTGRSVSAAQNDSNATGTPTATTTQNLTRAPPSACRSRARTRKSGSSLRT